MNFKGSVLKATISNFDKAEKNQSYFVELNWVIPYQNGQII